MFRISGIKWGDVQRRVHHFDLPKAWIALELERPKVVFFIGVTFGRERIVIPDLVQEVFGRRFAFFSNPISPRVTTI